jgi:hypothetical protein
MPVTKVVFITLVPKRRSLAFTSAQNAYKVYSALARALSIAPCHDNTFNARLQRGGFSLGEDIIISKTPILNNAALEGTTPEQLVSLLLSADGADPGPAAAGADETLQP